MKSQKQTKNTTKVINSSPNTQKKTTDTSGKSRKLQNTINIGSLIIFLGTAIYYLPVFNKEFLIKAQELSLFLPTKYFFIQHLSQPGGLLSWLGTFFTQLFFYPWLGSAIFISFILLVQFLAIKAFRIPGRFFPLTFVIAFALLLIVTQPGYMFLSIKSQGFFYSNLLGFATALMAITGYRKISSPVIRTIVAGTFPILFYPLFGFYALLAVALCVVYEATRFWSNKQSKDLLPVLVGIVSAALVPYLMYLYLYTNVELGHTYIYGLPGILFSKEEFKFWYPYFAIIASLLTLGFFSFQDAKKETSTFVGVIMSMVFVLSFIGFHKYTFKDENFHTEIAMSNAIAENRWEDVLKLAKQHKDEPTRLIVMQTNLALQKLGRGGDEMFLYRNGSKEMNTPWPARLIVLAGRQMYYQYGQTNYCYHWCMEDMVERGMRVEYLKYMVKCSIIKGEMNLARKYNNVLKQTLFHKAWATEHEKYIEHPKSMLNNSEFNALRPLTAFNDELKGNSDVLELDLLKHFANSECPTLELLDLSLQSTLILRNNALFWPRFFFYVQSHTRIPRYYQEAALLYSYFQKGIDVSKIKFDQNIADNFNQFMQMTQKDYSNDNEINKQVFSGFKDTYWYYYFFIKDIKMH